MRKPAAIEARIAATERWIASLRRRVAHGEAILHELRCAVTPVEPPRVRLRKLVGLASMKPPLWRVRIKAGIEEVRAS